MRQDGKQTVLTQFAISSSNFAQSPCGRREHKAASESAGIGADARRWRIWAAFGVGCCRGTVGGRIWRGVATPKGGNASESSERLRIRTTISQQPPGLRRPRALDAINRAHRRTFPRLAVRAPATDDARTNAESHSQIAL